MEKDISKGYLKYEKNLKEYSGKKKNTLAILYNIIGFAFLLITLFAPLLYCEVGEEKFYYSFVKCIISSFSSDGSDFGFVRDVMGVGIGILFCEIISLVVLAFISIKSRKKRENENREVKYEVCGINLKYAYSKEGRDCLKAHGRFSDKSMLSLMDSKLYDEQKYKNGKFVLQDASHQNNSLSTSFGDLCLIVCITVAILMLVIHVAMNSCVSLGVTLKEEAVASLVLKYGTDTKALESACESIFLVQGHWIFFESIFVFIVLTYKKVFDKSDEFAAKSLNNQEILSMMCVVSEIMAEDRVEELKSEIQALQSQIQAQAEAQSVEAQISLAEQTAVNEEVAQAPKRTRKTATSSQTKTDK